MSRPGGPYRDEQYPPRPRQYPPDEYQQGYPPRGGHPDLHRGNQGYDQGGYQPGYDQGGYDDRGYVQGRGQGYDQGYDRGGYDDRGYDDRGYRQPAARQPAERPRPEPERYDDDGGRGFRIPGLGLVLSLLGLVVQVLSLTVLPWISAAGGTTELPKIWNLLRHTGENGFGGAYVLLFSYPLAVLGVLLSLVAVIQSVAMKVIWAILAIIGVAALALRFGWDSIGGGGFDFSRKEIIYGVIALAVLVVVIFMLRMAMSTFRIVGGIILLVCAGVHVAALNDMTGGQGLGDLGIGAYGPAAGYVLAALAAFIGPRKIA
ncbi:hypothetical protein [Actinophytocola oryzae]|uniref:Uncharacterized protein n=1 Tax=Actinophytocola oryzae TaxID=502181 RepID=A0A4R7W050_9PSEU|nr:hypothetical protein [Actinophytocola oryzae]TDV55199.1 hypothetical protein CLV71_103440 [Actinophytocola oryzae]